MPTGIIGTDNVSPIHSPYGTFHIWAMWEIYLGNEGNNKYIPRVNDHVYNTVGTKLTKFKVVSINPVNMVAVLAELDDDETVTSFTNNEVLLGDVNGNRTATYRVYLNTDTIPFKMDVDHRLKISGNLTRYAKVFKGVDTTSNGKVISKIYDNIGNVVSENVPLELVANDLMRNVSIKIVSSFSTSEQFSTGDVVTIVFYDDNSNEVSSQMLMVVNTNAVRNIDESKKHIVNIALESPFINQSDPNTISYPINVPLSSLNLTGVITYSDGAKTRLPIDGTRFSVFGLEKLVVTSPGQRYKVVLNYKLQNNESSYIIPVGAANTIGVVYNAIVTTEETMYNMKLFVIPTWINAVSGYRLNWYLYNLDRNIKYDVTQHVSINTDVSVFNPILYGVTQSLSVSINIKDVNPLYRQYIHTQSLDIVLNHRGGGGDNDWVIGYISGQLPRIGTDVFSTLVESNQQSSKIKIDCGLTNYQTWSDRVYKNLFPVFNTSVELGAPDPNILIVEYNGKAVEIPIAGWVGEVTLPTLIERGKTVVVHFARKVNGTNLYLAAGGFPVR